MAPKNHFFSYETKVSLELPLGWEELREEKGLVIYMHELDDGVEESKGEKLNPIITITTFSISTNELGAFKKISSQVLNVPQKAQQILQKKITEIDGYPASVDFFSYEDDDMGGKVVQYQVFVQIDFLICSITGIADLASKEEYFSIFEEAAQSIRFILM